MGDVSHKAEEWRPVVGYEGLYEVSDHGRIRSRRARGPNSHQREADWRFLRPGNMRGYRNVVLCHTDGRKKQTMLLHRLVAEAFLGPANGRQVDHINFNKADNRVENLRWCSPQENSGAAARAGRYPSAQGETHRARLTTAQVLEIRAIYDNSESTQAELARQYGVHQVTIFDIVARRTWKHLP